MSNHIEVPARPMIQPWPGLGTRIGFVDPGNGFLEDGSVNVMINRGDILAKRNGFIRGLDEQFNGAVCGLFKYTSTCGVESLLVADQAQINIRTPYAIPIFENSDAYPFDAFADDGTPSTYYWRNIGRYAQLNNELILNQGLAVSSDPVSGTEAMRWFKNAANLSYQMRVEYRFNADSATTQQIALIIKGVDDLSSGTYLISQIKYNSTGTYSFALWISEGGSLTELGESAGVTGDVDDPSGFFTIQYERDVAAGSFRARAIVISTGGNQQTISDDVTAVQDASLGQTSAVALGYSVGIQPTAEFSVLSVDSGPL